MKHLKDVKFWLNKKEKEMYTWEPELVGLNEKNLKTR